MTGQFRQRLYETLGVLTTLLLFLYLWISEMIPWARHFTKQNNAIQQELHSRITAETPISGFYGPGAWWAWLITTGMAHGHVAMALWKTRELPSGWNPDFIVASLCTVAAEIDLIAKSRAIARLGETASQTVLLPALVSAERAVVVGSGSALVSTVVGLFLVFFGHSKSLGIRTAGIALIPVLLGFVASAFTLSAHRTIAHRLVTSLPMPF
ncbi:hypothetical protein B0H13DRAFT_2340632 [Mycena leptocephala]|nr:hypothetical protein B0H13DRAFT_2340632 [Mycena leptocephala]